MCWSSLLPRLGPATKNVHIYPYTVASSKFVVQCQHEDHVLLCREPWNKPGSSNAALMQLSLVYCNKDKRALSVVLEDSVHEMQCAPSRPVTPAMCSNCKHTAVTGQTGTVSTFSRLIKCHLLPIRGNANHRMCMPSN